MVRYDFLPGSTSYGPLDGAVPDNKKTSPIFLRIVDANTTVCPVIDTTLNFYNPYRAYNSHYDSLAQITGKVFFDTNLNGVYDAGEVAGAGIMMDVDPGCIALTNANGNYTAYAPIGSYTVKLKKVTAGYTGDSVVVNAINRGAVYTGNNVALTLAPGYCEGRLSVVSTGRPPRPGFNHIITVQYHHIVSASPVSQTITFNYSPGERFIAAVPAADMIDTLAHVLTWNVTNIASASTWQANVTLYTPPTAIIGTTNGYSAVISNSTCSSMNSREVSQKVTVVGSFDPNDKTVSPAGNSTGTDILPSSELAYTIRFQNTGTYEAEIVRIVDTFSNFVDVNTLEVLTASHKYQVLINERIVTFLFSDIFLPDSTTDEPNSHGYVQYKVKVKDNAPVGTVINNTAFIYFDFNAPVVTNTTTNTLVLPNGIATITSNATMQLYPNPANDMVTINISDNLTGGTLTLSDVTGRSLNTIAIASNHNQLYTGALSSGVYLVTAVKDGVRVVQRLTISQ